MYDKGQIFRKPGGIPFKPGKKPGDHPIIMVAIPQMIVGRVIGKGGAGAGGQGLGASTGSRV